MSSNTKVVYSNRLVSKHEQFIIDKSLANKIKHVKSTIISGNQTFEKMISNRNKKDVQRSFICKLKSLDDPLDSETNQSENNPLFSSPHSREVSTKRSEMQPLRLITPLASENNENRVNSSFSVRSGPLPLLISPRIGIENRLGLKTPVYELSNVRVNNGSLSPMRVPSNGLKNMKTEKNENLKNKLIEKSLEIEALRSEMKDWRHYDQRGRMGYSKENIAEDSPRKRSEISTAVSSQQSGLKATKAVFGGKIMMNGLSSKAQSDKRLKKMGELETSDVKQMIKYVAKPATYEESLRILERFEEIERNKKNRVSVQRDQEKRTDRSQVMESPKTPIFKAVPNNLKFSTRFSRNLESGLLKANMRYSTEEVDLEEEQEKAESGLESQENGERGKGFGLNMKHKYIDNRKKTIELDGEEHSEEETKVYTKAKTIILQPKNLNFKLNSHSFRLPQVTRGEVSATE